MKYVKVLLPFCFAFPILIGGCKTVPIVQQLLFMDVRMVDQSGDCSFNMWHKEHLGIKPGPAPPSLDITTATVTLEDIWYIFEIETRGNIRELMERYGASVQFEVELLCLDRDISHLLTTDRMGEGVLVWRLGNIENVTVFRNPDNIIQGGRLDTKLKLWRKVKVETDGNRLRFYVRRGWLSEAYKYEWHVHSRFLPPPTKPFSTNLAHVFYVPSVVDVVKPDIARSRWGAGTCWREERVPKSKE